MVTVVKFDKPAKEINNITLDSYVEPTYTTYAYVARPYREHYKECARQLFNRFYTHFVKVNKFPQYCLSIQVPEEQQGWLDILNNKYKLNSFIAWEAPNLVYNNNYPDQDPRLKFVVYYFPEDFPEHCKNCCEEFDESKVVFNNC